MNELGMGLWIPEPEKFPTEGYFSVNGNSRFPKIINQTFPDVFDSRNQYPTGTNREFSGIFIAYLTKKLAIEILAHGIGKKIQPSGIPV